MNPNCPTPNMPLWVRLQPYMSGSSLTHNDGKILSIHD